MATVKDIFERLNALAPTGTQMDFDNAGLLVGSWDDEVRSVLCALDITMEVIGEAGAAGADLLVSHHPLFFERKHLTDSDAAGRRALAVARSGMAAICMHTNLDIAAGGVNDALSDALGVENAAPFGAERCGRIGRVEEQSLYDFMARVKGALHAGGLRYVDARRPVRCVAVLGGAGGGEMLEAFKAGADTYVTADVKHHQFLDARELGLNLIDAGHFPTENVIVPVLAATIAGSFPEVEVRVSRLHGQPERFF